MSVDRDHRPYAGSAPAETDPGPNHRQAAVAGRLETALRMLDAAENVASPAQVSSALAEVARSYRELGQLGSADWHFQQALRWARTTGGTDACVDLLCESAELAITVATRHDPDDAALARAARERARDQSFEATRLVQRCADPQWEVSVLIRISDVLDHCGDHEDALALHCRALQLIMKHEVCSDGGTVVAHAPHSTM